MGATHVTVTIRNPADQDRAWAVGIEVDPTNQRLKRLPAVRLKTLREPTLRGFQR